MKARSLRHVLLAAAVFTLAACGGVEDLSGIWQSESGVPIILYDDVTGPRFLEGGYARLIIGQYGRDVGGVIKIYDSPLFNKPLCDCSLIHDGHVGGRELSFAFEGCASTVLAAPMFARLRYSPATEPTELAGDIFLATGDVPLEKPLARVTLTLRSNEKGITMEDKRCDQGLLVNPTGGSDATGSDGGGALDADAR